MNREQELAALVECAKKTVIQLLSEGQEPRPIALGVDTDGAPCIIEYQHDSRGAMRACLAEIARRCPDFTTVNTAWTASAEEVAIHGYPEACPGRKTIVLVQTYSHGKVLTQSFIPFEPREGGGFTWGEWTDVEMEKTPDTIFPS